jgi:hypothetical protein
MIDFDNVTMGIRSDLQTELKRLMQSEIIRGKVAVQRAYADWRRYPQYMVPLAEASIDTIQATAYGSSKKNATDIRLAVDAVELVFTRPEIGTYILLSGDSDFSSLVLKLKEYGKYVIGVGIRESSSDLLVMNCDEYYSYNELAGLTRASDVEHVRHDPWELVVEAVKQMTAHNDVMRSDRLKQVMQEIDPGFDEKDAGFSRFSKFVQEAAHRGLIATERLDNGQFEISLGAKVDDAPPPAQPAALPPPPPPPPQAPAPRARKGSIVGDAFGLLRQALGKLSGDQAVSADAVREAMNELAPEGTKRVDARSMPKLLRQAHDAELIDLSRDDEGSYAVRVRQDEPADAPSSPAPALEPVREARPPQEDDEYEPPQPASSAPPPPYSQQQPGGMPMRSARFRRGSRGPRPAAPDTSRVGVVEVDPNFRSRVERMPPRSGPTAPVTNEPPSVGGGGRSDDDHARRERSGRGRGGRGRGRGGNREGREGNGGHGAHGGHEGREGRESREGREGRGGGEGERSRGRRGGRGRGGRGGGRSERNGENRPRSPSASETFHAPEPPAPPPPPAPRPAPPAESREEGDSFWSRVKRGLIGGQ